MNDYLLEICIFKELYLAYNDIAEISPLTMLDNLQVLDLEGCVRLYYFQVICELIHKD